MTTRSQIKWGGICAGLALAWTGCTHDDHSHMGHAHQEPGHADHALSKKAIAVLSATQGNTVKGTVVFTTTSAGVRVVADITGLTPGEHGFHIHDKGDCSAPDGSSAGGHFNPMGVAHGAPGSAVHHMGDLGNLMADSSGNAHLDHAIPFLSMEGTNTIVGRSVIVHAGKDDLTSQPAGNAGARVACGVIQSQ